MHFEVHVHKTYITNMITANEITRINGDTWQYISDYEGSACVLTGFLKTPERLSVLHLQQNYAIEKLEGDVRHIAQMSTFRIKGMNGVK